MGRWKIYPLFRMHSGALAVGSLVRSLRLANRSDRFPHPQTSRGIYAQYRKAELPGSFRSQPHRSEHLVDNWAGSRPGQGPRAQCRNGGGRGGDGSTYRTRSNSDGYYTVRSLPPARYKVSAKATGFKETASEPFALDASSTVRIDLTLALADSKQEISVTAAAPAIESEQSMVSTTISEREMEYLPLQGRGALEALLTSPNISGGMDGTGMSDEPPIAPVTPSPGVGISIGGGQFGSNSFLADGAASTSAGLGRAMVTFTADNVQEVKIIQSTYSAQYGSTGGGVVSVITKSGTNELRGTALWFNTNPAFGARTFGSSDPPGTRKNEFGLIVGGPVVLPRIYNGHNKTFFMFSVEPKRFTNTAVYRMRVATAAERQGDFRNTWVPPGAQEPLLYQHVQCIDSACSQLKPANRATATTTVYPLFCANCPADEVGHVIPQSYISPLAQKAYAGVPLPNSPYDSSGDNLVGSNGNFGGDNRWSVKIDHQLNSNNRITGRFIMSRLKRPALPSSRPLSPLPTWKTTTTPSRPSSA